MHVRVLAGALGALFFTSACSGPLPPELSAIDDFDAARTALLGDTKVGAQHRPELTHLYIPARRTLHVATNGNDGNPGTADRPLRTVQRAVDTLRAGEAAQIHGGVYKERIVIGRTSGTASAPIRLIAAPGERPILRGGGSDTRPMVWVRRAYWILDGLEIDAARSTTHSVRFDAGSNHSILRGSEVHGSTGPAGIAIVRGATDIAILDSEIHDHTWGANDSHGIIIGSDTARVLVSGNHSWGNSGDSVQCAGPDTISGRRIPEDVTIERNRLHHDRENAVDIKTCKRVTIRGNKMYGYRGTPTAPIGSPLVVHYSASQVLIEENRMWDNGRGLSLGGNQVWNLPVTDVVVRRNLLFDHVLAAGGMGDGLRFGTSRNVEVYNNTIYNMPGAGIRVGDGSHGPADNLRVFNNVIVDTGRPLDVYTRGVRRFTSERNLFWNGKNALSMRLDGGLVSFSAWQNAMREQGTLVADPRFVENPRYFDFYTMAGSPARDVGLRTDGETCGAGTDLGFLESCF